MIQDSLSFENKGKELSKKAIRSEKIISTQLKFGAFNSDIVEPYYWHLNFAYYVGKGFKPIKLEDHNYFSENNQFGQGMRQVKGGSIRAFQENLQQLIQLVKVHMFPLLKEIKEAHFYKMWLDRISENDSLLHQELSQSKPNPELVKKYRAERDEALLHIKDKWVSEVDSGRMYQMQRPANEQGLDFALLPQLFFGTKLDDPFERKKSLKEQLDEYVYDIDVTEDVLTQLARFHFRFYNWLPTVIRETQTTFKIKVAALKQFYTQLQMYIDFMKPLLIEISKKSEGVEFGSFYKEFESENPEFFNMLDYSYSFIRILGIKGFERKGFRIPDLEFSKYGLFVEGKGVHPIKFGTYAGKNGFITGHKDKDTYFFKPFDGNRNDALNLSKDEFDKLKEVQIPKLDLMAFPSMEFKFAQKRRTELVQSQQGPQQVPYMINQIDYTGWAWNIYELASYREQIKEDNLLLLETFIEEIGVIKEELLFYVNDLEGEPPWEKKNFEVKKTSSKNKPQEEKEETSLILAPIQGLGMLVAPLLPSFSSNKKAKEKKVQESSDSKAHIELMQREIAEDTWKCYTIFKKAHGYIQY